jgi:glucokinase
VELSCVLAYDIGGSHATAGLVNCESRTISCVKSCAIDSNGTAYSILEGLHTLGDAVVAEAMQFGAVLSGIALAVPGPFDYKRGISLLRHKYASLYGVDIKREFEDKIGIAKRNIVFLNDAQAFLLGENHAGAAKSVGRCIGITLGTGVGSAFSINGSIVEHGKGIPPGGNIYCLPWKTRTVEDWISTGAIRDRYQELTGDNKTVREICAAALNDPYATVVMQEFGANLGMVLQDICIKFRAQAVVLGGAISRSADQFLASAMAPIRDYSDGGVLRISTLFDNAPLIGAAVRWDALRSRI